MAENYSFIAELTHLVENNPLVILTFVILTIGIYMVAVYYDK